MPGNDNGDEKCKRSELIEQWLKKNAEDSFWCPRLRAKLTKRQCAERHVDFATQRWFGQEIEVPSTPAEQFCRGCPLGAIHAKKLKLRRKDKGKAKRCAIMRSRSSS